MKKKNKGLLKQEELLKNKESMELLIFQGQLGILALKIIINYKMINN
jgi:hypothetical protein